MYICSRQPSRRSRSHLIFILAMCIRRKKSSDSRADNGKHKSTSTECILCTGLYILLYILTAILTHTGTIHAGYEQTTSGKAIITRVTWKLRLRKRGSEREELTSRRGSRRGSRSRGKGEGGGRSKRLVTCDFRLLTVTVRDTPGQAAAAAARLTARSTCHVT